ncbi:flagellar hook-length control protein FliK [Rhodoferax sp. U2-2l]|uniref:flagellar hook-length control protein FliK n=1 Tax=Rhodoferax sp. U2-2l TaxID=2884000 RepID=UPI001D0A99A6|nr:flagellar hook-length control protein FliK [Rhodoferax sp. U2-2l]MCB8748226.1 flagellar hook-length control protein FliK [Rhodoferax sp. U2-2l]
MTIDTTRAPEGAKPASAATVSRGASAVGRAGAAGAPGAAGAGGGFAGLLSALSAPDAQSAPLAADLSDADAGADAALTPSALADDEAQLLLLATDMQGLVAVAPTPVALATGSPVVAPASSAEASGLTALIAAQATPLTNLSAESANTGPAADAPGQRGLAPSQSAVQAPYEPKDAVAKAAQASVLAASDGRGAEPALANTDVATLLDHRRASQSHAAAQTQLGLRDARWQPASAQVLAAQDASSAAPVILSADALTAATDRRDARPGMGQIRTGLEGAAGGNVADRLGINPTYEVAAATAVVSEGQVAETVSYWASQGVQSAELTLDGMGDEPVEVRISLEGDQAQIEFRSNQPEVRQALEGASAQLKALLSGEGLQLTGMSVGTSNRGASQGEGGQPKPSSRQAKLVALEPVRATATRAANPAVGQALDLYV